MRIRIACGLICARFIAAFSTNSATYTSLGSRGVRTHVPALAFSTNGATYTSLGSRGVRTHVPALAFSTNGATYIAAWARVGCGPKYPHPRPQHQRCDLYQPGLSEARPR